MFVPFYIPLVQSGIVLEQSYESDGPHLVTYERMRQFRATWILNLDSVIAPQQDDDS